MPKKKVNPNSQGYTNALLEEINDKFQVVLEATQPIPAMSRRLEATFEEVGQLRVDVDAVKRALDHITDRLAVVEQAIKLIDRNTSEIDDLRRRVKHLEAALKAR